MLWEATPEEREILANIGWDPTKAEKAHINFRLRLEQQRLDLLFSDQKWMKQLRHDYDRLRDTEKHLRHILVSRIRRTGCRGRVQQPRRGRREAAELILALLLQTLVPRVKGNV